MTFPSLVFRGMTTFGSRNTESRVMVMLDGFLNLSGFHLTSGE